jgi:hypothetical protein
MGGRIEGRVMVHSTDIAGGSAGQTSPGSRSLHRRARNGALLLESNFSHKQHVMPPSRANGRPVGSCHSFRIRDPGRL